jgi:hypothetical protein
MTSQAVTWTPDPSEKVFTETEMIELIALALDEDTKITDDVQAQRLERAKARIIEDAKKEKERRLAVITAPAAPPVPAVEKERTDWKVVWAVVAAVLVFIVCILLLIRNVDRQNEEFERKWGTGGGVSNVQGTGGYGKSSNCRYTKTGGHYCGATYTKPGYSSKTGGRR